MDIKPTTVIYAPCTVHTLSELLKCPLGGGSLASFYPLRHKSSGLAGLGLRAVCISPFSEMVLSPTRDS